MFDPENTKQIGQLREAMRLARQKLHPFRQNRLNALREYVGSHYSDNGTTDRVPINMLELAINTYSRKLAARAPRALVSTKHRDLKPFAADFELAINHLSDEIDLESTFLNATLDGLFGMGIVKVGLHRDARVEVGGYLHDVGQPFADTIDLDDFVFDSTSSKQEEWAFCGHRFRLPLEVAQQSGMYDEVVIGEHERQLINEDGDPRVSTLYEGEEADQRTFKPILEAWELWLPQDNLVVTVSDNESITSPLRVVEWDGPEHGPFHFLRYNRVPGNPMPLPPVALWLDIHLLANRVFNKLGRQVDRQKTILGVQGASEEDGRRIVDASDGDAVRMDNPKGAQEFHFGGLDQQGFGFLHSLRDFYSYYAGNLDAIGGLGPQSDTARQDELLTASASERLAAMQSETTRFAKDVMKSLGWYLWADPSIELPLVKSIPGVKGLNVNITFSPETREGDFLDYNFEIEPYSNQAQSPSQKLQNLLSYVERVLLPFREDFAQQGKMVDVAAISRLVAEYSNMTELDEILVDASLPPLPQRGPVEAPRPSATTHTNVRVNRPGATRSGRDQIITQAAMGGNPQQAERNSIMRPTGA